MPTQLRYPIYDMDSALEGAGTIIDRGGGTASLKELAEFLNYKSVQNGAFINRVSAIRLFGFVEGPPSALTVTRRASDILHPEYVETAARARLEAFLSVPLYQAFLGRYEGATLPPDSGMVNALVTQFGVPPKRARIALARLLDSAEQAGLFKVAGNRSKLIVPTIATGTVSVHDEAVTAPNGPIEGRDQRPRHSKLIEGALELLPKASWDEDGLHEWLDLIEGALRVQYGLPRKRGGPNTVAEQK
jgi:hypothetical protein